MRLLPLIFLSLSVSAWSADNYPTALPPQPAVRAALTQLPQIAAMRANTDAERATSKRLATGEYEWTVRATAQRRSDSLGPRYNEQEIAVERPLRLISKARKDEQLGETGVRVAEARLSDAWHEAARGLLKNWFDWMREARTATRLNEQVGLQERQVAVVQKRVKAGDAPAMEAMLAETELARIRSAFLDASHKQQLLEAQLRAIYGVLDLRLSERLPEPVDLRVGRDSCKICQKMT